MHVCLTKKISSQKEEKKEKKIENMEIEIYGKY